MSKLLIVNLHDGLIHPQTKERLSINRQLVVEDLPFWLRRIEQGHCALVTDSKPEPKPEPKKTTRRRMKKAPAAQAPAAPEKEE